MFVQGLRAGTLSNDDDKENNNVKKKKKNSARASRFLVHFFDVHCTATKWNFQMRRFIEDVDILRQFFPSLFERG